MNKCLVRTIVLFIFSTACIAFAGCAKDLSDLVSGEYEGTVDLYYFGTRPSETIADTTIVITKVNQTTIRIGGPGGSEFTVKYDGTFGTGFYTPRGTFFVLGNQGKFINDSLYFSSGSPDYLYSFRGRKK